MRQIRWNRLGILLLLLGSMVLTWRALLGFQERNPAISLRWRVPLTQEQLDQMERYLAQEDTPYAVTLWREQQGTAATETASLTTTAVRYRGSQRNIQRLTFLRGSEPGELERNAGLVSEDFALGLWGSTDVVGQLFSWEEETFTVSAVFQGKGSLAYLPQREAQGFCCLELTGAVDRDPVAAAYDFVAVTGLEPWDSAVFGPQMSALLMLLSWLPLALCGLWSVRQLTALFPIRERWLRRGLLWGVVLLLAALIPVGIGQLPGWLTPPQWSDFEFWYRLWESAGERLEEWLWLPPWTKDVTAKRQLLLWALGWSASLFCLSWNCYWVREAERGRPLLRFRRETEVDLPVSAGPGA